MSNLIDIDKITLPADIKHVTRRKILEVFKSGEKRTALDVHVATGISKPTVMRTIQYFCSKGVLASVGLGQASSVGGKRPEYFAFSDHRKILCITMWPNGITLALSELVGDVYGRTTYPTPLQSSIQEAFAQLASVVREFLDNQQVPLSDLYGVEFSTSGTVDYRNGSLRYNSQAPQWGRDIPVEEYLAPIFGSEVEFFIENAGKASGRALLLDSPELSECRVLTIFSTWGISACLIENGHVLNGKDSLIGEIGHMTIDSVDEEQCGCGKHGCLERLVSIERITEMLRKKGVSGFGAENTVTFQSLFAASAEGNGDAREVVVYLAHCFAVALHNLSLVYNPDVVVFQGDFALADEYFDQCMMAELVQFRYYPHDGVFYTAYDRRELTLLAAKGGAALLKRRFFAGLEE